MFVSSLRFIKCTTSELDAVTITDHPKYAKLEKFSKLYVELGG